MVLGQVISKLSEGDTKHVPFRESLLTRILKNSLGGNTKTAIICTVTPAEDSQTKSTLDFAARAKKIVQHATVNEVVDPKAELERANQQMDEYKKEIERIKNAPLSEKNDELEKENSELLEKLQNLQAEKQIDIDEKSELLKKLEELQKQANQNKWMDASLAMDNSQVSKKAKDRRMTWCAPPATTNRRVSFGGALRLKKLNLEFEKPKTTSLDLDPLDSPLTSPDLGQNNISVRRKSKKAVQFQPILEDVFEDSNISESGNKSGLVDETAIADVQELRSTLLSLRAKLEHEEEEKSALQDKIAQLEQNAEEVQIAFQDKVAQLDNKIATDQELITLLEKKVKDIDEGESEEILKLKMQIDELKSSGETEENSSEENRVLQEKLAQLENTFKEKENELQILLEQKIEALKTQTEKIQELEDLNADLKLDLCETKDELDKVNGHVDKMQSEIGQLKEQQEENLKSTISDLEAQNTKLETTIKEQQNEYENKIQSLTEEKTALHEKVATLEQDSNKICALQDRINQLEQDSDKVNALQEKIVQLEEESVEKTELEEKMVKDQELIGILEQMVQESDEGSSEEILRLKIQIDELKSQKSVEPQLESDATKSAQFESLKEEKSELETLLRQRDNEIEDLKTKSEKKLAELEDLNTFLNLEVSEFTEEIEGLKAKVDKLTKNETELKIELDKKESLKDDLEAKIQGLEKGKLKLAELESQEFEFEILMKNKDAKVKSLCEEIERLKKESTQLGVPINPNNEKEMEDKVEKIADLEKNIADLKVSLLEKQDELNEKLVQLTEVSAKFQSLEQDHQASKEQIDSLDQKLKVSNEEIEKLTLQIGTFDDQKSQQNMLVEELRNELEQAEVAKETLSEEIAKLNSENAQLGTLTQEQTSIAEELKSSLEKIEELKMELEQAEVSKETFSEEIAKLKSENAQLGILTQEHTSIAEELKSNLEKIANLEEINVDLQRSLMEAEDERDELKDKLVKLEEMSVKFQSLEQENQASKELIDNLDQKLKVSNEEIENLTSQIGTFDGHKNQQNMLVEELRNELEQAKAIDDELKNRDLIIEQYQSTIAGLESQITKLREHQNEHQMLSEQLRNLTEEHKSIAKERESNLEKIANLEEINVGLRASLVESEDEKNVLNSKLVKLEDLSVKFQSLDQDRQADQELIGLLEEKLKEAQDGQSEEIQRLKMQIDTLNNNNMEQNKLLSELRYELVQAEDLKDELEAKIKERQADQELIGLLEEKLNEAQDGQSEEVQKLKIQIDTLNNNNKEQNKLLSELRHELVQAEDLKDELEAKIKELQADQEIVGLLEEKLKEAQDGQSEEVYRLKMQIDTLNNNSKEQNKLLSDLRYELALTEDLKDELEAKIKERQADQELIRLLEQKLKEAQDGQSEEIHRLKMQIDNLNNNIKQQNKLLSELRHELVQAEDLKDELEAKIKELESSESNEYVKKIRDKMAAQTLELASMKVELKQSEGNQSNAVRKVHLELEAERGQVKRLKEEIRRMTISQRSAAKDLDSTYVAPARSNRQPLAEKPVEVACKNCQNIEGNKGQDKARIQDEDAFMKYEGKGNESTDCLRFN